VNIVEGNLVPGKKHNDFVVDFVIYPFSKGKIRGYAIPAVKIFILTYIMVGYLNFVMLNVIKVEV